MSIHGELYFTLINSVGVLGSCTENSEANEAKPWNSFFYEWQRRKESLFSHHGFWDMNESNRGYVVCGSYRHKNKYITRNYKFIPL